MRQDYPEFARRGAEVIAIGPDGPAEFERYWQREQLPFVGLADPRHSVADLYGQEVKILRLGRMPALFVVDREGRIRHRHLASWMGDIPPNSEVLAILDGLNAESAERAKLD